MERQDQTQFEERLSLEKNDKRTLGQLMNDIKDHVDHLDLNLFKLLIMNIDPKQIENKAVKREPRPFLENETIDVQKVADFIKIQKKMLDFEIEEFIGRSSKRLEKETKYQVNSQAIEKKVEFTSLTISALRILAIDSDLNNLNVIKLGLPPKSKKILTMTALQPGNIVTISCSDGIQKIGSVKKITEKTIEISIPRNNCIWNTDCSKDFKIEQNDNIYSYDVMSKFLDRLGACNNYNRLVGILSNSFDPKKADQLVHISEFHNKGLTLNQIEAIINCVSSSDIYTVFGPPATGKTKVIVETILQLVKRKQRILVCSPLNSGLDNVILQLRDPENIQNMKIEKLQFRCCRLGNPSRANPRKEVQEICLENYTRQNNWIKKLINNLEWSLKEAENCGNYKLATEHRNEADKYAAQIEGFSSTLSKYVVDHCEVVFSTLMGANDKILSNQYFDVVIIDECAQALELTCWIPIMKADRLIIAGDDKQNSPTIMSEHAKSVLGATIFHKFGELKGFFSLLKRQFRMNQLIWEWPRMYIYKTLGDVESSNHCKNWTLQSKNLGDSNKVPVLVLIDTNSEEEREGSSRRNQKEAAIALWLFNELLQKFKISNKQVGIISPYAAQTKLINNALGVASTDKEKFAFTVDAFQGQEREAIIISMVRTDHENQAFLTDERLNVAVTRAKRYLAIIGNLNRLRQQNNPGLKSFIDYFEKKAVKLQISEQDLRQSIEIIEKTAACNLDDSDNEESSIVSQITITRVEKDIRQENPDMNESIFAEYKIEAENATPVERKQNQDDDDFM